MNKQLKDWQTREVCKMDSAEYDAEVSRRLWRRRLSVLGEIGGIVALAGLIALFCLATPPQRSAECDMQYHIAEQAEAAK